MGYKQAKLFGNVDCAKFYVAGVAFALDHLQSKQIVYRDLKPENLVLTDEGHVKLTDMGLAKVCTGMCYTMCGTVDYFAPEVITGEGYGLPVDWWTLGILMYELLVGQPPFQSDAPYLTYPKITDGFKKVKFPESCNGHAETLVKGLCRTDPDKRLPVKPGGIDHIKNVEWYVGFNWNDMEKLNIVPPYRPPVTSKKDTSNFHAVEADAPAWIPYEDPGNGWEKDFATILTSNAEGDHCRKVPSKRRSGAGGACRRSSKR